MKLGGGGGGGGGVGEEIRTPGRANDVLIIFYFSITAATPHFIFYTDPCINMFIRTVYFLKNTYYIAQSSKNNE